ncbi:hypothetical protein CHH28_12815 [Bacterioplanes sanyensis]|uniref:PasA protein n=1 Tax=Bacterioplanes sanyensis TaxID=1249553 RepID=A0A222FL60_9GAMM|nr:DUF6586 family protein [Bacterioplanes sanyensis]ASP39499.1 hypothetical protein CHH28_12815 [Bacterioplanes sanyensis]
MSAWIGHTNQKLYQARLLLQQSEQARPDALAQALEVSAIYHIHDAYLCYLHELAEMVQYSGAVVSLSQLLDSASLVTGEMQELKALEQDAFSWLATLLSLANDSLQGQSGANKMATDASLIAVAQPAESPVYQCYQRLVELIERQRENRQES